MAKKKTSEMGNLNPKIGRSHPLRVLMVEDSEDDVLFITRALKKGGYNPEAERVETAAAMKKALKEKQWDIILCDYMLPKFDAASAIAVLKKTNIDIPLIIVSGAIGEETAVECMRLGARDYIMKNNLSRLCHAIARELEEAHSKNKRKQAEVQREATLEVLRRSEEKYRNILENIRDGYFETDLAGNFIFINRALCRIWGYSEEELLGMNNRQYADKENSKKAFESFADIYRTGKPSSIFDYEIIRKNKAIRQIEIAASLIKDSSGSPVGFRGIARDITERKQMDEELRRSEERYRTILESTDSGYCEQDFAGNFTFVNDSMSQIYGYPKEELIGMNYKNYTDEGNGRKCFQIYMNIYKTGEPGKVFDLEIIRQDGTKRRIESSVSLQKDSEGNPAAFRGIVRDVTKRMQMEETIRQSEERYRTILDETENGYFEVDLAGNFIFLNDALCRHLGYSREELIGTTVWGQVAEEDIEAVQKAYNNVYRTGKPERGVYYKLIRKDGTKRFVEAAGFPLRNPKGEIIGFRGVGRDITQRVRSEEANKNSMRFQQVLMDAIPSPIFYKDTAGVYIGGNKAYEQYLGMSAEQFIGKTVYDTSPADLAEQYDKADRELLNNPGVQTYETSFVYADGTRHDVVFNKATYTNAEGKVAGLIGVIQDITERKRTESQREAALEELRQSEEKYRAIIENIQDGYFEIDLSGNFTFANEAECRNLGYPLSELIGTNYRNYSNEEIAKGIYRLFNGLYTTGLPIKACDIELLRKDGTKSFNELSVSLIRNSSGKPIGFRGISRDVTERKQLEETIRQSEERYRTILDEMEDAYFEVDLAGNTIFVNDANCRNTGYSREELIGSNTRNQMAKEDSAIVYKAYNRIYKTGRPEKGICYKYIRKDGSMGLAEITGFPLRNPKGEIIGFRGVGRDITEKRKIQFQLLQSEKMASIGQLAAGVAHEINNPISFVKSNLKTLSEYLNDIVKILKLTRSLPETIEKENIIKSDLLNKLLEEINNLERVTKVDFIIDDLDSLIKESQEGADRIIRIVRDLKTYAHPSEENLQMADVNENMESTLNIISNEIQAKADIYKEYGNIPKICCHPQELNQVFMNVLLNAAQAIKEKGEIRISTGNDHDGNIEIRIQDNGIGISEENLPKLFNPFFTTKDIGKGTGLGLHVAFSIIQKHEGKIEVESKLGVGTTFIIRLPAKHKISQ